MVTPAAIYTATKWPWTSVLAPKGSARSFLKSYPAAADANHSAEQMATPPHSPLGPWLSSWSQNQLLPLPSHTWGHRAAGECGAPAGSARHTHVQLVNSASTTQAQGPAPRAPKDVPRCWGRGTQPGPAAPPGGPALHLSALQSGAVLQQNQLTFVYIALQTCPHDPGPPGEHRPIKPEAVSQRSGRRPQMWSMTRPTPTSGGLPAANLRSWHRLIEAQSNFLKGHATP